VARQIETLTGVTPDPAVLRRIVERSGGIPLLVAELVAADGGTSVALDLVGHRVRSLPEPGRIVAEAAAVGGALVDEDVLFQVAGLTEDEFDAGARSATTSGVLEQVAPDRVGFRHELLREATLDALAPRRRRELHRRWAEVLASTHPTSRDGWAATLAAHWTACGDDQHALPALLEAATEADRVFAYRERLRLLLAAADAWDRADSSGHVNGTDLATVLADAAELAQLLGEHDVARDLVDRGRRLLDRPEDLPRRAWFDVVDLWVRWNDARAIPVQEVQEVVDALRRQPAHRHVVMGLFALHSSLLQDGRPDEALLAVQEARSIAVVLGDRRLQSEVAGMLAHVLSATGDCEGALRCAERERAFADELGDPYLRAEALVTISVVLWESGDVEGALAAAERGRELMGGRQPGPVPREWALHTCNAVEGLLDLGRWDQAGDWLDEVLAVADLLTPTILAFAGRLRRWLDVVRGQDDRWLEWLAREPAPDVVNLGIQDAAPGAMSVVDMCCHAGLHDPGRHIAAQVLAQDRVETAIPAFVWPLLAVSSRNEVEAVGIDLREPPLTDRLRQLARVVPAAPNPVLQAHAFQVAADLARLDGEPDLDLYRDAAERWQRLGMPYWHAWALLRVGESAARDGLRDDARSALLRASGIARDLRAAPLARRVETTSRAHRIRVVTATDASAATVAGLTRREVEVLHLLDEGASNRGIAQRLVISEKTVSVHVSHLLAKLHAGSRGEAVAAARLAGLLDDSA
jgi:DNA-binding CsgD family transcriptional regulator/tetratricopeptide (TPR) repeat protein